MLASLLTKSLSAGNERYRRAILTSLTNMLSQLIQLATGLVSVPLTLNYVGVERFGIWMTLSTAIAFITFTDFGIGIGVQDQMSRFTGIESHESARKSFSTALGFVLIPFTLLMAVNLFIVPHLDFASALSLKSDEAINDIVPTTQMIILILGLGLLSGIVQRAFNALQDGFLIALIQALMRVASFLLLFVVVELKLGLPAIVFVVGGIANIGLIVFGIPLLAFRHRWIIPPAISIHELIDIACLTRILEIGALGLSASIAIYFVNNSIPVLISGKYGAENVADYSVLLKLTSAPSLLISYVLLPLWPAITEARARNDYRWIKNTYRRCTLTTLILGIVFSLTLLLYGNKIILLWTRNESVIPSSRLLFATVIFMGLGFWNTTTSVILNGLSRYKSQATYGLILAITFSLIASQIPNTYEKDCIIWVIGIGYFIRCIFLQMETSRFIKSDQYHA